MAPEKLEESPCLRIGTQASNTATKGSSHEENITPYTLSMAMDLNIAPPDEEEHGAALHEQPVHEEDEAALHDELQLEHHFDLNMDPGTLC